MKTGQGGQAHAMSRPRQLVQKNPSTTAECEARIANGAGRREMTPEERHQMIAEGVCYRALRRGSHGGSDLEDWLDSEAEIDKLMWHG